MVQMYGKYFKRRAKAKSFSRAEVDEVACTLNIVMGEVEKRGAFFEILPEEAVYVFYGTLFPGVIGFGKEMLGAESVGDFGVAGELATIVKSDCFQDSLERGQMSGDSRANDTRLEGGHQFGPKETRGAVEHGDDGARPSSAKDSVDLNVAQAGTPVDDGGTHGYVHSAWYKAAVVVLVGPLLSLPATVAQVFTKMAVLATPAVDPAIDGLVAHHVDALQVAASRYLLGAPLLLRQFLTGNAFHVLRETYPLGLLTHPSPVFFMSQDRVVDLRTPVPVASQLPVDCASVHPQLACNLCLGKFVFQHPRNFVPLHFGKMFHLLVFWKEHKSKHFSAIKGEVASFLRFSFEIFKAYALPFPVLSKSVAFIS